MTTNPPTEPREIKETNMSTRKIADLPKVNRCRHPEHKPPAYMVYPPGIYEHICPGCGEVTHFTVNEEPTL